MVDPLARRIHELLNAALELDIEQRQAFLLQACQETPALAARADQLLAAVSDSQTFLEEPALHGFGNTHSPTESELPRSIGNYDIVRPLGSGGMGSVYEAMQRQPQRTVALKIPKLRRWNQDLRHQWRYESELLGQLRHAHIAQVYEAGIDDSVPGRPLPYFAMEYVPTARSIRDYVSDRDLGRPDILQLMCRVCDAIQHAHQLGIIHRDLKPANILVDAEGQPKVIDFGIASMQSIGDRFLKAKPEGPEGLPMLAGTLNYMSPEQCEPTRAIDARTDVYSLGVILFELLCDALPYDLQGLSIVAALEVIRTRPPEFPNKGKKKSLPFDLQAILNKALAKASEERYPSVEAFRSDIGRYLASRPIVARQATVGYILGLMIKRNRWLSAALALLLLAISAGTIGSGVFAWQAANELQKRRKAESETLRQLDQAVWQSYVANMHGAFAAFQNREVALVRSRLAAAPPLHRNWEWDFVKGMIEINEQVIPAHEGMILGFATSPDKNRWATGSSDGVIRVWENQDGKVASYKTLPIQKTLDGKPEAANVLSFRNGASQLLSGLDDGRIRIWDLEAGSIITELVGPPTAVTSISVRPDGSIAWTSNERGLLVWNGITGQAPSEIRDEQTEFVGVQYCDQGRRMVTWDELGSIWLRDGQTQQILQRYSFGTQLRRVATSSDGSWMAAGGRDNRVQLWRTDDPQTEGHSLEIPGRRSSTDALCFSDDNLRLAVGRVDRQILQYSLQDFTNLGQLQGHEEFVRGLTYDPTGKKLLSASGDGTLRVWNALADELGNVKRATGLDLVSRSLAISPDGARIAVAHGDRSLAVYDRELNLVQKYPVKHLGVIDAIAWSPLGKIIATAGLDRSIRLWNPETGDSQSLMPLHAGAIYCLVFSPDGQWLVSAGDGLELRVWNMQDENVAFESTGDRHAPLGGPTGIAERSTTLTGHTQPVQCLAFSPDGRWLASGGVGGETILWDWATKEVRLRLRGHEAVVYDLVFDPSGQRLYTGSRDRTIRVWSTHLGTEQHVLAGHGQLIRSLDINADGTRLVAGSWFGDIQFWDLKRHEMVATFKGHDDIVFDLEFGPEGSYFVSCSLDRTLKKFGRRSQAVDGRGAK